MNETLIEPGRPEQISDCPKCTSKEKTFHPISIGCTVCFADHAINDPVFWSAIDKRTAIVTNITYCQLGKKIIHLDRVIFVYPDYFKDKEYTHHHYSLYAYWLEHCCIK